MLTIALQLIPNPGFANPATPEVPVHVIPSVGVDGTTVVEVGENLKLEFAIIAVADEDHSIKSMTLNFVDSANPPQPKLDSLMGGAAVGKGNPTNISPTPISRTGLDYVPVGGFDGSASKYLSSGLFFSFITGTDVPVDLAPGESALLATFTIDSPDSISHADVFLDLRSTSVGGAFKTVIKAIGGGLVPISDFGLTLIRSVRSLTVESVTINTGLNDPAPLPAGDLPETWSTQRSSIDKLTVNFSENVHATVADFTLTNLGVDAPVDDDEVFSLGPQHFSNVDSVVELNFAPGELPEGVYKLEISDDVTSHSGRALDGDENGIAGGDFDKFTGVGSNLFYVLHGDWHGDGGVSIFDFTTFSYWFGVPAPLSPTYVDINDDGGVSVFDFSEFSDNFGVSIVYPPPPLRRIRQDIVLPAIQAETNRQVVPEALQRLDDRSLDSLVRWKLFAAKARSLASTESETAATQQVDELMATLDQNGIGFFSF